MKTLLETQIIYGSPIFATQEKNHDLVNYNYDIENQN